MHAQNSCLGLIENIIDRLLCSIFAAKKIDMMISHCTGCNDHSMRVKASSTNGTTTSLSQEAGVWLDSIEKVACVGVPQLDGVLGCASAEDR